MLAFWMEISDLKSAATLLTRYYTIQNCEDFQMRYCASIWLKKMQKWERGHSQTTWIRWGGWVVGWSNVHDCPRKVGRWSLRTKYKKKQQWRKQNYKSQVICQGAKLYYSIGRWSRKCPCLSTWGGLVKKGQNLVHVVCEWTQRSKLDVPKNLISDVARKII